MSKKPFRNATLEELTSLIGEQVEKISRKPFKSKLPIATIKGVMKHPITGNLAFTFYEDETYVEAACCRVIN